jgi:uncharacterized protein with beta-barrel porin domain
MAAVLLDDLGDERRLPHRREAVSLRRRGQEDSLLVEAGFDLNLSPTAMLGVSYSGQIASDLTDNAVKGRFTWLF